MDKEQPMPKPARTDDYPDSVGWPFNPNCSLCEGRRTNIEGRDGTPMTLCPVCDEPVLLAMTA